MHSYLYSTYDRSPSVLDRLTAEIYDAWFCFYIFTKQLRRGPMISEQAQTSVSITQIDTFVSSLNNIRSEWGAKGIGHLNRLLHSTGISIPKFRTLGMNTVAVIQDSFVQTEFDTKEDKI